MLVGGRSSRMGSPKAALEWHGSTLLYRTSALLRRTVGGPVVVVASPGQQLPALPSGVEVVEDPVVVRIAQRLGATPAQVGLAWLLGHRDNILLIPGTGSVAAT